MLIWSYLVETKPYKLDEKKLHSKIVHWHFIRYLKRSNGYKFYDPTTKFIFKIENINFFEDIKFVRENKIKNIIFEK